MLIDVQQRVGEVTEMAEESAVGIRVIKAFGREERPHRRASPAARPGPSTAAWTPPGCSRFYQPLMGFLPVLGLAVILAYGGLQAIDGDHDAWASSSPSTST